MKKIFLGLLFLGLGIAFLSGQTIFSLYNAFEAIVTVKADTTKNAAQGIGFFIAEDYLLTNAHYLMNSKNLNVEIRDKTYRASLVSYDLSLDYALLYLDNYVALRFFTFTPFMSDINERITLFNPNTKNRLTNEIGDYTGGITELNGFNNNYLKFQFSSTYNPESVGGPILDQDYYVIGLATSYLNDLDYQNSTTMLPSGVNIGIKNTSFLNVLLRYTELDIKIKENLSSSNSANILYGSGGANIISANLQKLDSRSIQTLINGAKSDEKLRRKKFTEEIDELEKRLSATRKSEKEEEQKLTKEIMTLKKAENERVKAEQKALKQLEKEKEAETRARRDRLARIEYERNRVENERISRENIEKARRENERIASEGLAQDQLELDRISRQRNNFEKIEQTRSIEKLKPPEKPKSIEPDKSVEPQQYLERKAPEQIDSETIDKERLEIRKIGG